MIRLTNGHGSHAYCDGALIRSSVKSGLGEIQNFIRRRGSEGEGGSQRSVTRTMYADGSLETRFL
jgi:hypothetical protein